MSPESIRSIVVCIALAGALFVSSCGRDQPTEPRTYVLTGRVRLEGTLIAADSHILGTRVVDDADGVPVDLMLGSTVVASTHTSRGSYRFEHVSPGGYFVRARIHGSLGFQSTGVTIAASNVDVANPVVMRSVGDLYPAPNPVDSSTVITYAIADNRSVALGILRLDGTVVRHLQANMVLSPGLYLVNCDGRDDHGAPLPSGVYWATLASGADERAQLLFR